MASSLQDQVSRQESTDCSEGGEFFESTEGPELEYDERGLELEAKEAELDIEAELEGVEPVQQYDFTTAWDMELARESSDGSAFRSGSITPDGLIDEDFEKELGTPSDGEEEPPTEFDDVSKYNIIEVAGDDTYGRKVIIISACKLPPSKEIDHNRLLIYMKRTLDLYVENDYVIVYFHYGLTSKNKPKLSWLLQIYREMDRKYKKNLKALYLVHPTNFIKILWNIFKPFIRPQFQELQSYCTDKNVYRRMDGQVYNVKFGKKMMYISYLQELKEHLHFDQLVVPLPVLQHDAKLVASNKPPYPYSSQDQTDTGPLPAQQFGVTLQYIKSHSGQLIPPVVEISVEFLRTNALDVEGIFRRSPPAATVREVQKMFDEGIKVDFAVLRDVHIPAVILKKFLRELQEPILTFDLFEPVTRLHNMDQERQMIEVKRLFREELPEDNYMILKYIVQFLTEVVEHEANNRMSAMNLSVVFGPNLLWPKGQASLASMGYLNSFTLYLIQNYAELFDR